MIRRGVPKNDDDGAFINNVRSMFPEYAAAIDGSAFTDSWVADSWAKPYVELARALGLAKGNPDGSVLPLNLMTKAEVATVVARLIGSAT
jgi:hypothetical protein